MPNDLNSILWTVFKGGGVAPQHRQLLQKALKLGYVQEDGSAENHSLTKKGKDHLEEATGCLPFAYIDYLLEHIPDISTQELDVLGAASLPDAASYRQSARWNWIHWLTDGPMDTEAVRESFEEFLDIAGSAPHIAEIDSHPYEVALQASAKLEDGMWLSSLNLVLMGSSFERGAAHLSNKLGEAISENWDHLRTIRSQLRSQGVAAPAI